MATSEKFCLRWNDFESNISVAFRELRDDKDFFDVTLACDENQIQAHKVILSACSPFFRTVLKRNKHEHPLLYLKGVKYTDIVAVLNFMYHGEVNVAQEELNSFLAVAEDLKVKGLTQNDTEKSRGNQSTNELPKPKARDTPEKADMQPPPLKRARPAHQAPIVPKFTPQDDDIEEVAPIKTEPISISHEPASIVDTEENYSDDTTGVIVAEASMDTSGYNDEYADYANYEAAYDGVPTQGASGNTDGNKGCEDIWSKLEKNGKIIRCRICGLNKHQDFFATLINHIRKDHL
eukprot:GFUD01011383.1.p1 GENE.GFUD01011383.1~~GFUD01011383.1.p1  ORF type:complete len:292 (+),score=63.95 GFUD01011383.1:182-1057(+)